MVSTRAKVITRRTYNRPKNEEETEFETWGETVQRVLVHQSWLWERAATDGGFTHNALGVHNGIPRVADGGSRYAVDSYEKLYGNGELEALGELLRQRKALVAGRTLWMGGTSTSQRREASNFNCSYVRVETVHDVVDLCWLLLQGCGVGFTPMVGVLNGFSRPIHDIRVVRTDRVEKGGDEGNRETWDSATGTWTIRVGDSGEAWAKAIGKLLAGKYPANTLTFDLSQIRPAGSRLRGYGWISSGDQVIAEALPKIAEILSRKAGQLLSKIDILDICNWLGVIQTGRRGAEIALFPHGQREWREFALAKREYWVDNPQRAQSNNSLVFWRKPTRPEISEILNLMVEGGGSEPGLVNGNAALQRAPWFSGLNPCAEVLLANKSFCNLTEVDLAKFKNDRLGLERAIYLIARANYRQTLVDLDDGILQRTWHENNEYLHLCGVGLTGIVRRNDLTPYDFKRLRNVAVMGAYSMADELGMPRPKNVTTIKPSGTVSKIMDTTEGCHKPLGRYIFNNINFSQHDPILEKLEAAGYQIRPNPNEKDAMLVTFPVKWDDVQFETVDGKEVNTESALKQLERYRMLMDSYVEQNCSNTIYYDDHEIPAIGEWLDRHWDSYVGVSFIKRTDPTKTAEDLGHPYLPQEVVTAQQYNEYVQSLSDVDLEISDGSTYIEVDDECESGVCPVR